jgi:hypothetical protein
MADLPSAVFWAFQAKPATPPSRIRLPLQVSQKRYRSEIRAWVLVPIILILARPCLTSHKIRGPICFD